MSDFLKYASKLMSEMDELLSKDDSLSHEKNERLQELYEEVKQNLEVSEGEIFGNGEYTKKESTEFEQAEKRFSQICSQFDTNDDIIEVTMSDMFPDEDSMEGFDWTFE